MWNLCLVEFQLLADGKVHTNSSTGLAPESVSLERDLVMTRPILFPLFSRRSQCPMNAVALSKECV